MPKAPRSYRLTADLVAAHAGASGIVALAASANGTEWTVHAARPDATTSRSARAELARLRGDMTYGPQGVYAVTPEAPQSDVLLVYLDGPIEERSGFQDPCGGWTDGHDAIYERLAAAFEIGDVILCARSPGGAVSGGPEFMRRAQEMKAKHGRKCFGHTETLAASMCVWWLAAICDEVYVSRDARIGAIGARAAHASIAGALAKEGVAPTFSAWPNDGKIAGVPELPLSDTGKARMDRDVAIAGEMFAATVAASPTATRAGLDRDGIVALGADMLTGQAAVDAGLADGVATLEDVMAYALATAGTGATMATEEEDKDKPGEGKAEGESEEKHDEATCAKCSKALAEEERYCMRCGTDRVPADAEDEDKETGAEDEPPPSSKPAPKEEGRKAVVAPAARQGASVAALLGLRADASHPAIMAELTNALRVVDHAASLTGKHAHGEIIGGLSALAQDAAQTAATQRALADERRKVETAERLALAKRAARVEGSRDGWLADKDVKGKRVVVPGFKAAGDLAELRGYVEGKERNAGPGQRNPFQPSPDAAKAASDAAKTSADGKGSEPTPAQIEAAKNLPAVITAASRPGAASIDDIARAHVAAFGLNPGA